MALEISPEMIERLEESARRYAYLGEQLLQPDVASDRRKFTKISKEHAGLGKITEDYEEFKTKLKNFEDSQVIIKTEKDKEIIELALMEVAELEPWLNSKAKELELLLLPKDPLDEKDVLLEIRAGVGGDESAIFVTDMYGAYSKLASKLKWQVQLLSCSESDSGGYKEIIASIQGDAVYSKLKFESGVHRVQRVPKTESQGRVHTSTITVAVLPEADEVELHIDPKELRIDVMRAGGAGGQHVNKTESAVRITHLPTGTVAQCQDEKSQHKNKDKAMKVLRARVLDQLKKTQEQEISSDRKAQVGGGFRNERIRTYNFPQSRVTDHRIGMTTQNIDDVMAGDIMPFIQALNNHYQTIALQESNKTSL